MLASFARSMPFRVLGGLSLSFPHGLFVTNVRDCAGVSPDSDRVLSTSGRVMITAIAAIFTGTAHVTSDFFSRGL